MGKSYGSPFGGKGWPIFHPSSLRKFIVLSSRALHGSQLSQGSNFAVPRDHTNHTVFNSYFFLYLHLLLLTLADLLKTEKLNLVKIDPSFAWLVVYIRGNGYDIKNYNNFMIFK